MYVGFHDDVSFRWGPQRFGALSRARQAHATVVRTLVRWDVVAPERPLHPARPFDSAYHFDDIDDLVRSTQQRGLEVLLTIWGTPAWASYSADPAEPPLALQDLRAFAHAVASRYSGRHPGFPFVRFYAVWNEPNNPMFLKPQSDAAALYAEICRAALAGIRSGSPRALVAIGETAGTHAPGRFVRGLARAAPELRFDAWAHHPYPPALGAGPAASARWPNVSLPQLARLEREIDSAFGRKDTRIWITEFAEQTSPERGRGVPYRRQASDLAAALAAARDDPRVDLFVWFTYRDRPGQAWQSGLVDRRGRAKPALHAFSRVAAALDARNPRLEVVPGSVRCVVRLPALELRWHIREGALLGVRYTIWARGAVVGSGTAAAPIGIDGWVPVPVRLAASPGGRYRVELLIEDVHGKKVRRTLDVVTGLSPEATRRSAAAERPRPRR